MTTEADLDLEPCPGCDQRIDCTLSTCPHCKYDLTGTAPKTKTPKTPKERKTKTTAGVIEANEIVLNTEQRQHSPAHKSIIMVPALGRMGRPSINFPALHWKDQEVTDETLIEWAENLRACWSEPEPRGAGDSKGWLSNHAIGYLAGHADGPNDAPLRENSRNIVKLIGGDDWNE